MAGLTPKDAAREAMRSYGFDERTIDESIEELLELYGGVNAWRLIEDGGYSVLLNRCLDKQEEQARQVAEEQEQEQDPDVEDDAFSTTTVIIRDTSPEALQYGEALDDDDDYHPMEGYGWISEEDIDGHVDDGSDDDEMIQLTPEPLCDELEELLRAVQGRSSPDSK